MTVNSKTIGERTEAIVLAELLKLGYVVLLPFGDNQRYDMVIEVGGEFKRVQCKTARITPDGAALHFRTCSSYAHRGRPAKGYRGEADLFGVYSPHTRLCYLVPVDEVGEREARLRLTKARNGQLSKIRLAEDFVLSEHMVL